MTQPNKGPEIIINKWIELKSLCAPTELCLFVQNCFLWVNTWKMVPNIDHSFSIKSAFNNSKWDTFALQIYIWLVFLLHNIYNWRTEQKHRHILCSVDFSSNAIKIWSTFPENIRIRDAYHAHKISQKLFMCYFGMGSKRVSNSSPVFISSEFIKGKSDTLFDPIPK
jgi:hypothetical protein